MLDHLNQIDNGVKTGAITGGGMLALPASGEAILFDCDLHTQNGNTFMSFFLTLPGSRDYRRFQIRLPSTTDKQAAQYLGMQRVYKTLYGAIKANPDNEPPTKVWDSLMEGLKQNSVRVAIETEERSYVSQRDGKEVKTTELLSITGVSKIPRVQISVTKQSEKPATTTPSAAGWGSESANSGGFGVAQDIPF